MISGRILVTGATGFIGSALIKSLRSEQCPVDGLSLRGGEVAGDRISKTDITSEEDLFAFTAGKSYHAIFHIAALIPPSFGLSESEPSFAANVAATNNILKLASQQKNCHVFYASSVAVYGRNHDVPLSETSPSLPDNYYALSKYTGELLCQMYSERIPVTMFRISSPYGPGYTRWTVINIFCREALSSGTITLYGNGKRCQDFIYIDDIVQAFMLAYKKACAGIFNLCSGYSVSMRELAELIVSQVPGTESKIVNSGQPDPKEDVPGIYSAEKSYKVMDFMPSTPLPVGLQKTLDWWKGRN